MAAMNRAARRRLSFAVVRWTVLLATLGWVTWEFVAHAYVSKVHPSVHALCPLGGLESLLTWLSRDGATLSKVFSATMGLFFASIGVALLFKRSFCGQVCPLGTLQELTSRLGRALLGGRRPRMPARLDRTLRWLKYPILVLVVAMAWDTGTLWMQAFDPWPAYAHLWSPSELFPTYAVGFGVLIGSLIVGVVFDRPFCAWLCPMGALTAAVGMASPFKVRRVESECIDCGLCDRACPANLAVSTAKAVSSPECYSCGECAAVCPVPGALDSGFSKKLRIHPAVAAVFGAGAFFLAVAALGQLGFDRTSGRQEPSLRELARSEGRSVAEFKAEYSLPWWILPSARAGEVQDAIPFARVAELSGLSPAELKAELGLDAELPDDARWGEAYGRVTIGVIAAHNGITVEDFKRFWSLPDSVGPDTPWREIERAVERAAAASGGEGH